MDIEAFMKEGSEILSSITPSDKAYIEFIRKAGPVKDEEAASGILAKAKEFRQIPAERIENAIRFIALFANFPAFVAAGMMTEESLANLIVAGKRDEIVEQLKAIGQSTDKKEKGSAGTSKNLDKRRAFARWARVTIGDRGPIPQSMTDWYSRWNPNGETQGFEERLRDKYEEIRTDAKNNNLSIEI